MFPSLGPGEMIVVMGIAVLLFGKRLPEVGRSLGKGIVEFKRGLSGMADDDEPSSSLNAPDRRPSSTSSSSPTTTEPTVPKFEPPAGPPLIEGGTPQAT